jgi:cytochrome c553
MKMRTFLSAAVLVPAVWAAVGAATSGAARAADAPVGNAPGANASSKAGVDFFEKKIRPVLTAQCLSCHSEAEKKRKGGLTLDTREGLLRGGDNGPAVVAGNPDKSLLIRAIRGTDKDVTAMPPKNSGGKLPDSVIRDFEQWVRLGAPDPRGGTGPVTPAKPTKEEAAAAARNWWSFQPVRAPATPAVRDTAWPATDIDRLVLAGLEARGLHPAPDADAVAVLRRLYFDLVGLPPPPEALNPFVQAYASDPQSAVAAVADKLLASREFGQRWGRHWLDVARYSESTGKDVNIAFPHAWRYRDYVIDAFNADKPYDQFLREQIAGDLLPAKSDRQKAEQQIATGFLAMGAMSLNEMNPRQLAVDIADEQIDTFSQAVLGLTIACARCHDHKFDPVSQKEYTAIAGIFLSTETKYGTPGAVGGRNAGSLITLPKGAEAPIVAKGMTAAERKAKQERLDKLQEELRGVYSGAMGAGGKAAAKNAARENGFNILRIITQMSQLRAELASVAEDGSPLPLAMGVADKPASGGGLLGGRRPFGRLGMMMMGGGFRRSSGFDSIADSPLFGRGEIENPGERVPRGFPTALTHGRAPTIPSSSSGRRELAEWLASESNPLTARVMSNRVWHWLMGRGIVESVDNFGTTGDKPANQPLLDHLAVQFVKDGWSVKKLIRSIVTSRTYRQAVVRDESVIAADPGNALFGRAEYRRLDAECIRDAMLAAAGKLDTRPQPGSLIAKAGDGPIGGPRFMGISEEKIADADGDFRSVYLPVARNILPESLAVFDFPDPASVNGAREATNVPTQALYLLNGDFSARAAKALAERVIQEHPGQGLDAAFEARLEAAYRLVLSRGPDAEERSAGRLFLRRFSTAANGTTGKRLFGPDPAVEAWTALCRALFSAAEFRYLR